MLLFLRKKQTSRETIVNDNVYSVDFVPKASNNSEH